MAVTPPPRYGERFAKQMECFGLLVVKKTWLMCPYKATVRRPSATSSSSALRPMESIFGFLAQAVVVKPPPTYGERFAKGIGCFGSLVVKKTWLMCPNKVTVSRPGATASSPLKNLYLHQKKIFF